MKIIREIEAEQWLGEGHPLPNGAYLCQPEVCWSADRKLLPRHWIDAEERPLPEGEPKLDFMCSGVKMTLKDGREYWRQIYPFAFWSVKSEASVKRDHRPVYLDRNDEALVRTFVDFLSVEEWPNPLPPRAEYRVNDGGYGRGFRPVYLKPGDWLVKDGEDIRAVSDAELKAMAA